MDPILKYFSGEKFQCSIGIVLGLLGLGISIYFLSTHKTLFRGISFTFIPLALFLLAICTGIVFRTPKDLNRVTTFYKQEPAKLKGIELPRMEKVMKTFPVIKKIEIGFILTGILMLSLFWRNPLLQGIGIGLIIQGIMLYAFDHFAEARGKVYLEYLKSL